MPAAGPQNTRAKQKRKVKVVRAKPQVKAGPTNTAQSYVSQGKAVERVANHQKRVKAKRKATAPARQFVSQGRAVEKRATQLGRQTKRVEKSTGDGSVKRAVVRELEGKGVIARTLGKAAKNSAFVSSGADSAGGVGAVTKLTPRSFKGSASISPKLVRTKDAGVFGRAAQDLVNFPAQALPSVYVPASAAVQAAKGNKKPAKKFIKDFKQGDPVYNAGAAVVEKAKGNDKAAAAHLKRAGKAASEHPGFTALEVAGVKGSIGRGIGRVVKAPERAPARLEGTSLEEKRTYSPDAIKRQREKATDKVKTKHAARLRAKAERATNDEDAAALHRKANRVDPTRMTASQVRRRVDEHVAATEDVRRINRSQVSRDVDEAVKPARKHGGAALSLVSQRIAKADKADLAAYRDEIAAHFDELPKSGKRANRQLRKAIDDVVNDPKADMGKVHAAARRYEEITAPLQKKLSDRGLLAEGQADKAKLIPYAIRHMGAKHDGDRIVVTKQVKRAGEKPKTAEVTLRPEAIRAHMKAHGVEDPAFLTQAPNTRGARNFYIASDKAASLRTARRTGEATRKGTFDAHPDTLRENAARAQGLADATDGFTNFIHEFGHRDGGKLKTFKTRQEADQALRDSLSDSKGRPTGNLELRPVRVNPWGGSKAQLQRLLDEVDSDSPTAHKAVADVIADAVKEGADGDGPWALVPKAAADQLAKHMRVTGPGALGKGAQLVNSSFRKTVLSTSPAWLVGNVAEAAGRSAVAKAGPRSFVTGRKVIRELERQDPEAAKQLTVRAAGGGHYSMAEKTPHRDHTQFEDTKVEGLARKAGAFWRAPGPKQAAGAWHAWTDLVFNQINRRVESKFQTAMLGKAIRDSNLMDGHTLKTGQKAVEQAARGLKNTNEQVAFGRAVDRMYGKYNKFSPEGRMALALYTPFVAWTLNAVRFVYDVLPRDHPTVTALIAASELATEEWRKDHGLDLFIENRVPTFLQGSIPLKGGGKFRASRYTPFGAFGSPAETFSGALLPQAMSTYKALNEGEDWKGKKLRVNGKEADEFQRWGFAAKAFAEATVPVLSVGERVAKDGPKALNPVKAVNGKKKKVRRSSGVTWDDGSSGVKWDDQSSGVKWGG